MRQARWYRRINPVLDTSKDRVFWLIAGNRGDVETFREGGSIPCFRGQKVPALRELARVA